MSKLTDYRIILPDPDAKMKFHSPRVLMNAARRLRVPGCEYVECPPAVMALGSLYSFARARRPSNSLRLANFWERMGARFAAAEDYAAADFYRG